MTDRQETVFAIAAEGISDTRLLDAVREFLGQRVPPEWWTAPASSTGNHHPSFALGDGGLVRHSVMVARWTENWAHPYAFGRTEKDEAFAAGLCHDGFKGGKPWGPFTDSMHAQIAADEWRAMTDAFPAVEDAIRCHFGVWDPVRKLTPAEMAPVAAAVALADYAASRKDAYDGTWPELLGGL